MATDKKMPAGWFTKDGQPIKFVNVPDPNERENLKLAAGMMFRTYRDFIEAGFSRDEAMQLLIALINKGSKGEPDEQ